VAALATAERKRELRKRVRERLAETAEDEAERIALRGRAQRYDVDGEAIED
jgi:hypothetical protein